MDVCKTHSQQRLLPQCGEIFIPERKIYNKIEKRGPQGCVEMSCPERAELEKWLLGSLCAASLAPDG